MSNTPPHIAPPSPGASLLKAAHSPYEPDIWVLGEGEQRTVIKTYARSPRLVRTTIGRWVTRREARTLKRLRGIPGIPQYISREEPWTVTMGYLDAESLPNTKRGHGMEAEWFDRLAIMVRAMHERGVNHGDLRRTNIMRHRQTGEPCLVDFAQSMNLSRPRTIIGRTIRHHAFEGDFVHLYKIKGWYTGNWELPPDEMALVRNPPPLIKLGRFLRKRIYKPIRRSRDFLFKRERT